MCHSNAVLESSLPVYMIFLFPKCQKRQLVKKKSWHLVTIVLIPAHNFILFEKKVKQV